MKFDIKDNSRFKIEKKDERFAVKNFCDGINFPFMKQNKESMNCTSLTLYNSIIFFKELLPNFLNENTVSDLNKVLEKKTGSFGSSFLACDYLSKNNFGNFKLKEIKTDLLKDLNVFVFCSHMFSVVKNLNTGHYIMLDSLKEKPIVLPIEIDNSEKLLQYLHHNSNCRLSEKFSNKNHYKLIDSDLTKKFKFDVKDILD